jgi:hypothetical protein
VPVLVGRQVAVHPGFRLRDQLVAGAGDDLLQVGFPTIGEAEHVGPVHVGIEARGRPRGTDQLGGGLVVLGVAGGRGLDDLPVGVGGVARPDPAGQRVDPVDPRLAVAAAREVRVDFKAGPALLVLEGELEAAGRAGVLGRSDDLAA